MNVTYKNKKIMSPVLGNRPMVSLRGPMAILVRPHSFVPVSLVWPNASHLTPVRTQWRFLVRPHSFVPFDLWEKSHRLIQIKDNFWFSLIKNVCYLQKKSLKPSLVIGRWCPCGDPWRFWYGHTPLSRCPLSGRTPATWRLWGLNGGFWYGHTPLSHLIYERKVID